MRERVEPVEQPAAFSVVQPSVDALSGIAGVDPFLLRGGVLEQREQRGRRCRALAGASSSWRQLAVDLVDRRRVVRVERREQLLPRRRRPSGSSRITPRAAAQEEFESLLVRELGEVELRRSTSTHGLLIVASPACRANATRALMRASTFGLGERLSRHWSSG